jgi:serine/threonine protein phosphatase 1
MKTIAIGDIHGNLTALNDLLSQLTPQLKVEDTVVFLGDYIDRGPETRGCIERIIEFQSSTPADVVTLFGNHEDWLLKTIHDPTRHSWILGMDAFPTIASYSTDAVRELKAAMEDLGPTMFTERVELPYDMFLDELPESHLAFLTELVPYHRVDETVFVHAGVDPSAGPVEEQDVRTLAWGPDEFPERYGGSDLVIYGHWNNAVLDRDGWPAPRFSENTIGIDTILARDINGGRVTSTTNRAESSSRLSAISPTRSPDY